MSARLNGRLLEKAGACRLGLNERLTLNASMIRDPAGVQTRKRCDKRPMLRWLAFLDGILVNVFDGVLDRLSAIQEDLPFVFGPHSRRTLTLFRVVGQGMQTFLDQLSSGRPLQEVIICSTW